MIRNAVCIHEEDFDIMSKAASTPFSETKAQGELAPERLRRGALGLVITNTPPPSMITEDLRGHSTHNPP